MIKIIQAAPQEAATVATLALRMWNDNTLEGLTAEFAELLASEEAAIFLLYANEQPVAFAQCQLRHDYVEGTETSPVGYLEGIYVDDDCRGRGYAKMLLCACEDWAKSKGCTEFASDCELENTGSLAFHLQMGFEEANRVICFTKKL
ncbi:MAG: GNAT family N-acetyltransferase [Clostridia bacterium]|nr:GNAT family N-acetyltransferase [Clostridia bacterium]